METLLKIRQNEAMTARDRIIEEKKARLERIWIQVLKAWNKAKRYVKKEIARVKAFAFRSL